MSEYWKPVEFSAMREPEMGGFASALLRVLHLLSFYLICSLPAM
jgi:hypothetical protein